MSDIQKEIKEALEKATPGPWFQITIDDDTCMQMEVVTTDKNALAGYLDDDFDSSKIVAATMVQRPEYVGNENWIENAHLIANAPTWLLHQQELIEQQTIVFEKIKAEMDRFMSLLSINCETHGTVEDQAKAYNDAIEQKDAEIARLTEQRNRTLAEWGKTLDDAEILAAQLEKEESL